jgi:hypothetical protein
MSSVSVFRVIRVVKKAGRAAAGRPEGPGQTTMGLLSASHVMGVNPYLGAVIMGIMAFQAVEPMLAYYMGATMALDPRESTAMSASDRIEQMQLKKTFGAVEGENLFRKKWGDRQIEVDLRGKLP